MDELVLKIRDLAGDEEKKVVLLVDSMEQIRGVGEEASKIHDSVVELFSGQAANLAFPKIHIVYTVPPYLPALADNVGRSLGGHPVTQWPNIHVRRDDNHPDEKGLAIMASVIEKRCREWESVIPREDPFELAEYSGSDLRDFFRLVRECALALRISRRKDPEATLEPILKERAIASSPMNCSHLRR